MRKPDKVSSNKDNSVPCSLCTLSEVFFRFFPIILMMKPATGTKTKMKNVSFTLADNIEIMVIKIIIGSLKINSKIDRKE